MPSALHLLLVFAGAGLGGVARYMVNVAAVMFTGPHWPWGTMTVNVVGSLAMGLLAHVISVRLGGSPEWKLFAMTGILGGFTTFSAFSLDAWVLWERGMPVAAVGYVAASVGLSILALVAGFWLGRVGFGA